ncbi:MAG TPA: hypothetical protein VK487_06450 [Candidatus Bathyarchaeia archaeon]|nr:hypothetical protein [Candidatus Bathyarchaeia archaeon]
MQQTIRALGWATKLLWIVLIVLIVTIAYSATQITISFGQPITTATMQILTISMPVNIHNEGLYDIYQLNATTRITDQNGTLVQNSTLTEVVPKGADTITTQTLMLNITKILTEQSNLLFNDTTLTEFQYVAFDYADAIPLSAHGNYSLLWGAPLSNLAVSNPSIQPYNSTYSLVSVQISFENHNQYIPLDGNLTVEIYNLHGTLKGRGTASIDAQPNTSCSTEVDVLVRNSVTSPRGTIDLFFETSILNYGPVVIPLG